MAGSPQRGFTLVELSIVLVIIGLLAGGVMVGRDLVQAASLSGTLSQLSEYNQGVNAFRDKYMDLPGDLQAAKATQLQFATRTGATASGDGNRLIQTTAIGTQYLQGGATAPTSPSTMGQGGGEAGLFWRDLSSGGMIKEQFTTAAHNTAGPIALANIDLYLPKAKVGPNYFYIYAAGNKNFFGLAGLVDDPAIDGGEQLAVSPGLTPEQAFNLDNKVDDGLPATGTVTASYGAMVEGEWDNGVSAGIMTYSGVAASANNAPAESGDCYDSSTSAGFYAITATGDTAACGLSFPFQ